jgi:phosphoribosylglycinamide formyltransferase 1
MLRVGVLGSSNGSDLPAIVKSINEGSLSGLAKIAVVLSDKEDAGILQKAKSFGIPNFYIDKEELLKDETLEGKMSLIFNLYNADLIACIGYKPILGREFINNYPNQIMNIHPGPLPDFPGPEKRVYKNILKSGIENSACTLHFIDEGVDTGPIIMKEPAPILPGDDFDSLKARTQKAEQRIYPEGIRLFALGKIKIEGGKVIINYDN